MSWQSPVASNHNEHLSSSPLNALDDSARFLRLDVKSYWDSLTLQGLEVYEEMYRRVADDDGQVSCTRGALHPVYHNDCRFWDRHG